MTTRPEPDDDFIAMVAAAINALNIHVSVHDGVGSVRADFPGYEMRMLQRRQRAADQAERMRIFDEWKNGPADAPWPFP